MDLYIPIVSLSLPCPSYSSGWLIFLFFIHVIRLIERSISEPYDLVRKMQLLGLLPGVVTDSMEVATSSSSRSFINLPKELFEMLSSVGPHLYRDTLLLQKVWRP